MRKQRSWQTGLRGKRAPSLGASAMSWRHQGSMLSSPKPVTALPVERTEAQVRLWDPCHPTWDTAQEDGASGGWEMKLKTIL